MADQSIVNSIRRELRIKESMEEIAALRNPLGVMSNAVYFLQTVLSDADESTKEYLNIIKSEIAGSERIVSDLLDAVRTKPPHPEAVDVAESKRKVNLKV